MAMLCSNCSANVKPIAVFDLDGTLSEYHRSLYAHIVRYHDLPTVRADEWDGAGNYEDWIGITQTQYRDAKLAYRQGGYKRTSQPYPGLWALLAECRRLRRDGELEVWIATARPWLRMDNIDPDTQFWLNKFFKDGYDHLLYGEDKYRDLAEIVDPRRVVMVVDDLPEMYAQAVDYFGFSPSHLVRRSHNAAYRMNHELDTKVVSDLQGVAALLQIRTNDWWSVQDAITV
jgi:phosphoglycolate phosphatase-like HAD superfamily hydrolase